MGSLLRVTRAQHRLIALIKAAMREHSGSVPDAAKQLGVSDNTLWRYLRTLQISVPRRRRGNPGKKRQAHVELV
jgi:molybdenum-dependent DNA-binding transcriptional regulator ModE